MIEILRSLLIDTKRETIGVRPSRRPNAGLADNASALSCGVAKSRLLLRRVPDEWALLFGIGFAIGIAAGSFFT